MSIQMQHLRHVLFVHPCPGGPRVKQLDPIVLSTYKLVLPDPCATLGTQLTGGAVPVLNHVIYVALPVCDTQPVLMRVQQLLVGLALLLIEVCGLDALLVVEERPCHHLLFHVDNLDFGVLGAADQLVHVILQK